MGATKKKLRTLLLLGCAGWLLVMIVACGGSGAGSHEGTYCNEQDSSQCFTLTALQGGTDGTDLQGAMNTIQLTIGGETSTSSECSWTADRPGCDFVFGPSTITRPPNAPITTIEFYDEHVAIIGARQPSGVNAGTHFVK